MSAYCPSKCLKISLLVTMTCALLYLTGCAVTGDKGDSSSTAGPVLDHWPTEEGQLSTAREGCLVLDGPAAPGGEITFALTEKVNPTHAPVPHNRSERVVFAQLYETLVNVACDGTVTPGLAEHWTCTEDSTTWVFTLREGARFWDGTRVTAETVKQAWATNQSAPGCANHASPWSWINASASSITAVDARRLAIQLPEHQARFPLLLAHPAAAVAITQPGWTWPVGSGPARLRASDPAPRPNLECRPNPNHPHNPRWKSLVFRITPGTDLRDLVTTEMDLTLTRDLGAVQFFAETPGFSTVPLPWDRLYLLVCPPETNPTGTDSWAAAGQQLQVERDLTDISARTWPHIMFPVSGASKCPQLSGPITGSNTAPLTSQLAKHELNARTIAYPAGTLGAAELAGRLSHLAGSGTHTAALDAMDLKLALQWQMAGAFIIVQDQIFPTGCLQLATLLGQAPWLQKAGLAQPKPEGVETLAQAQLLSSGSKKSPAENLVAAGIVHPLALSRGWLVVHNNLAGLNLSFDGTPLLYGVGPAASPAIERTTQVEQVTKVGQVTKIGQVTE